VSLEQVSGSVHPYKILCVDSLSSFVAFLEENCTDDHVLFRGQRRDWPLKPKLARLRCRESLVRTEESMLKQFARAVVGYTAPGVNLDNIWDVLALAQHHGMATRLLDWSSCPLVALWFALDQAPGESNTHSIVWCLCPREDNFILEPKEFPGSIGKIQFWEPRHISKRISAQAGAFTVHPYDENKNEFGAVEDDADLQVNLHKIFIPAEYRAAIRYHLDRCGVNAASIYQDIDGLARHVEWSHSFSEDEGLLMKVKNSVLKREESGPVVSGRQVEEGAARVSAIQPPAYRFVKVSSVSGDEQI
jgi:hypothetical protein